MAASGTRAHHRFAAVEVEGGEYIIIIGTPQSKRGKKIGEADMDVEEDYNGDGDDVDG